MGHSPDSHLAALQLRLPPSLRTFGKAVLTSSWWMSFTAATAIRALRDEYLLTGAKTSSKSTPSFCLKPLATSLALNRAVANGISLHLVDPFDWDGLDSLGNRLYRSSLVDKQGLDLIVHGLTAFFSLIRAHDLLVGSGLFQDSSCCSLRLEAPPAAR